MNPVSNIGNGIHVHEINVSGWSNCNPKFSCTIGRVYYFLLLLFGSKRHLCKFDVNARLLLIHILLTKIFLQKAVSYLKIRL